MSRGVVLRPPKIEILLPGTFDGTIRLRRLWLHNNPLKTLEHFSFPSLLHLKLVDLSHCQLRAVGLQTFQKVEFVEELKLEVGEIMIMMMMMIFVTNHPAGQQAEPARQGRPAAADPSEEFESLLQPLAVRL